MMMVSLLEHQGVRQHSMSRLQYEGYLRRWKIGAARYRMTLVCCLQVIQKAYLARLSQSLPHLRIMDP
jgi:hypothetical protein